MRRVLALHCGLASGAAWREVAAHLPDRELACPDLPGHGQAPDWDEAQDFQTQALGLALAAAGDGPPLHVLGHSFGATLGLRLLVERPDLVRSLALVEPVMFAAAGEAALTTYWIDMTPFEAAMAEGRLEDATRAFQGEWGDGRRFDDLPPAAQAALARRIHLIPAMDPAIVGDVHGVLARLPALDAPPVLIVTRETPTPIVAAMTDGLAALLPGSRRATVGQTHMTPLEAPEALAATLRDLWDQA